MAFCLKINAVHARPVKSPADRASTHHPPALQNRLLYKTVHSITPRRDESTALHGSAKPMKNRAFPDVAKSPRSC
jgi:hypothetical protein